MTKEKQRIAIAEVCGWTKIHQPIFGIDNLHGIFPNGNLSMYVPVPDYLNDLNAMHEAEKMLNEAQQITYTKLLSNNQFAVDGEITKRACWESLHATATQRAEAFLRTIEKWID